MFPRTTPLVKSLVTHGRRSSAIVRTDVDTKGDVIGGL